LQQLRFPSDLQQLRSPSDLQQLRWPSDQQPASDLRLELGRVEVSVPVSDMGVHVTAFSRIAATKQRTNSRHHRISSGRVDQQSPNKNM